MNAAVRRGSIALRSDDSRLLLARARELVFWSVLGNLISYESLENAWTKR